MQPHDLYQTIIYKIVSFITGIVYFDVTNPNYKVTVGSYIVMALTVSFEMFSIYTCATENLNLCMQCLLLDCFGAQGIAKMYMSVAYHAVIQSQFVFLTKLYRANEKEGNNKDDMWQCARLNMRLAKVYLVIVTATGAIFPLIPFIVYAATHKIETFLPVCLPFTRKDTVVGYIIHTIYGLALLTLAYCGTAGDDLVLMTLTMHYWPLTRILDRAVYVLNSETRSRRRAAIGNSVWGRERVRNIVLMHREIHQYVGNLSKLAYAVNSTELFANELGLIILVYCILVAKWIPGTLLFLTMLIKLFACCFFGTVVEVLSDRVYNTLVNIDITEFAENEKKLIIFMIHQAQHPHKLRAGILPLNVEKFVEVMKTIYTVAMLLLETV